jgi:bifunctional DNase/RNase
MEIVGVRLEMPANAPVLVMREQAGLRRVMTIYIGGPEASAIHTALEGLEPPRPLTHDLAVQLLEATNSRVERIIVTEVRDATYFAHVVLSGDAGQKIVSARPSDAVALALRSGSPIFVEDDLLDEVGRILPEDDADDATSGDQGIPEVDQTAIIDEFRDFIDSIKPEDFTD